MSFPLPPLAKRRDSDYEVGNLLGRGVYTSVYQAIEIPTGRNCALKVVDRYRCERLKKTADLYMEKHCLLRTNHANIVKMFGWFSDNTSVFVVMEECMGGELWEVVKTAGLPRSLARHYLPQVITALEYLRQANIVHRDLKAENIMLTDMGVVKLIDFGTAKDLENPQIKGSGNASRHKVFDNYVGTPQFMPAEVIENRSSDFRSDTWSLGCTIFQALTGCPPFHGASEYLIFTRIIEMDLQLPPGISPDACDLIKRLVVSDADARLGAVDLGEVRRHPYFDGVEFEGLHERPQPVMSLVDHCLRRIGKLMDNKFSAKLDVWDGRRKGLSDEVCAQIERMKLVHKWQDDVLPPEECR
ncbi:unnamed protein product [Polarella glacialis]|uniref:Protein kinase domain-containing protein n=1 Tax=Polarella glacialis TaxID=89957 RepID=A0A813D3X7_POLGL|nr:unnamed protein product [Polarella glacialis]